MLQVYNHYLNQTFTNKPRHSTAHKRSELKNIYKSITNLNAKEPLYKIDLSTDQQTYALGIKEASLALQDCINEFTQSSAVFDLLAAVSDSPNSIDAKLIPSKKAPTKEQLLIDVEQLASGQENKGTFVSAKQQGLHTGNYAFSIAIDEVDYSFQFKISKDTTNFDLQNKLADFINKTGIGIDAQVHYNREAGLSRLQLSAIQTGTTSQGTFSVKDNSYPEKNGENGGILSFFGVTEATKPANNTIVSINGETIEVPGNKLVFQDNISLTFLETTKEPVQVRVTTDTAPVLKKLSSFTDTYNHLIDCARTVGKNDRRSKKLLYEFSHFAAAYQTKFNEIGLQFNEEGKLQIEPETAKHAILNQQTQSLFTKDSSLIKSLNQRLRTVSLNPMDYVDKLVVTYPNTTSKNTTNPYITSLYSGMLFNNYC